MTARFTRVVAPILVVLTTAIALAAAASASAATFGVNTQDDVGDGLCDAAHCSLRDAIEAANATAGVDEISARHRDDHSADAAAADHRHDAHQRASGRALLLRHGWSCSSTANGADFPGLVFAPGSDGSVICLVNVRGFTNGIEFQSNGNAIRFSTIGTSLEATAADPNSDSGILVTGDNNLIGGARVIDRNVISGNTITGIFVAEAAGTRIEGNLIGTDSSGSTAIPNAVGVLVEEDASDTTVGGTAAGAGNVISGNELFGVISHEGRVVGNLIGLDAAGTAALPNGDPGLRVGSRERPDPDRRSHRGRAQRDRRSGGRRRGAASRGHSARELDRPGRRRHRVARRLRANRTGSGCWRAPTARRSAAPMTARAT